MQILIPCTRQRIFKKRKIKKSRCIQHRDSYQKPVGDHGDFNQMIEKPSDCKATNLIPVVFLVSRCFLRKAITPTEILTSLSLKLDLFSYSWVPIVKKSLIPSTSVGTQIE